MNEALSRQNRRMRLLIHGALALYESIAVEDMALLEKKPDAHPAVIFDAIGSALHWMRKEEEK